MAWEPRLAPIGNTFKTFGSPPCRLARSRSFAGYIPHGLHEQHPRSLRQHAQGSVESASACDSDAVEPLEPEECKREPWPDTDDEDDECSWLPSSHAAMIPFMQIAISDGFAGAPDFYCTQSDAFPIGSQFGIPLEMTQWKTMSFTTLPMFDPSCLGEAGSSLMAEHWAEAPPPPRAWGEQPEAEPLKFELEDPSSPLSPPAEHRSEVFPPLTPWTQAAPAPPGEASGEGRGGSGSPERREGRGWQPAEARAPGKLPEVTTLMLRNLPRWLTQADLVSEIHASGFKSRCDFCYLPRDFNSKAGRGHAFVNLTSPAASAAFQRAWQQKRQWHTTGELQSPINISTATVQGLAANMANPKRMRVRNPHYKPYVLPEGEAAELRADPDDR